MWLNISVKKSHGWLSLPPPACPVWGLKKNRICFEFCYFPVKSEDVAFFPQLLLSRLSEVQKKHGEQPSRTQQVVSPFRYCLSDLHYPASILQSPKKSFGDWGLSSQHLFSVWKRSPSVTVSRLNRDLKGRKGSTIFIMVIVMTMGRKSPHNGARLLCHQLLPATENDKPFFFFLLKVLRELQSQMNGESLTFWWAH